MNRKELAKIFKKEGVRSDNYSLYGTSTNDGIIINKMYTKWYYRFIPDDAILNKHYATWEVFYSERGHKRYRREEYGFRMILYACQIL